MDIAIPYWTGNGHTRRVAEHVAEGIGPSAWLLDVAKITDPDWQRLNRADAIVFGAPTYMGSVAAGYKVFMDASGDLWEDQLWADKIAAGFTVATYPSGDKLSSLTQLVIFAAQHGMVWVGQDLIGAPVRPGQEGINYAGFNLGLAATSSRDKTLMIGPGDIETARHFGKRIAVVTERWLRGA